MLERVEAVLAQRAPAVSARQTRKRAAVLIALTEDSNGRVYVWLTKRSDHLRANPGEIGTLTDYAHVWGHL